MRQMLPELGKAKNMANEKAKRGGNHQQQIEKLWKIRACRETRATGVEPATS